MGDNVKKKESVYLWWWFSPGFPDSSVGEKSACNAGDSRSIFGSGRPAGEGIGYPLQYSGPDNSMDWIVHGVTKSQTWLSDFHFHGGGLVPKLCTTLLTLWTVAHQAPLSMGFSRQEYWSGLLCCPPGDLPNPGTQPLSPALQAVSCIAGGFFTGWATRAAHVCVCVCVKLRASQVALVVKNPPVNARELRDMGSVSGWGRSLGRGHGNPLQCSFLENPMDRSLLGYSLWGPKESDTTEATWHTRV